MLVVDQAEDEVTKYMSSSHVEAGGAAILVMDG
jgi:hypothetical protein